MKDIKSNPIDEEFERRKFYREQIRNQQEYGRRSVPGRYKRGPGVGTSIMLVVVGLIVVVYLVKSFSGSKTKTIIAAVAPAPVYKAVRKHHKRKHEPDNIVSKDVVLAKAGDTGTRRVSANNIKLPEVKPLPVKQIEIVNPVNKASAKTPDYLYSTIVKSNITGIVNMREFDRYDSAVIAVIPADSKVYVIERGSGYYKVTYYNNIGYVPKWALEVK
jgi:hypothetical protein